MSDLTLPVDGPLIIRTLKKPFLPGRQVFALYKDHVVIAIVRGPLEFPDEIHGPNGPNAWRKLAGTRRVSVLPLADVEWIQSYEHGTSRDNAVQLTFLYKNTKLSVFLPEEEGALALAYLAEKYADKLDPRVESAIDAQRKLKWVFIFSCLFLDGWVAWALWELWTMNSITGPAFLVDIMGYIYEARGFGLTAFASILGAVCFNLMMLAFSFFRPTTKPRALNCSNCGYYLRGVQGAKCPECGSTIKRSVSTGR